MAAVSGGSWVVTSPEPVFRPGSRTAHPFSPVLPAAAGFAAVGESRRCGRETRVRRSTPSRGRLTDRAGTPLGCPAARGDRVHGTGRSYPNPFGPVAPSPVPPTSLSGNESGAPTGTRLPPQSPPSPPAAGPPASPAS